MSKKYVDFIKTLNENTAYIADYVLSKFDNDKLLNCTDYFQLEKMIVDVKPKSKKEITTICYVLSRYAAYKSNDNLYRMIKSVDRNIIWEKSKTFAKNKFISKQMFDEAVYDIGVYEELNSFYYQCIIRCIYEGIYSDGLTVLSNLRASNINNDIVKLYISEVDYYNLKISKKLAEDLIELSKIDTWQIRGRWSIYNRKIAGCYADSCFKFNTTASYDIKKLSFVLYKNIRKITSGYFDFKITPLNIYISGIMYRIKTILDDSNIDLHEAFSYNNKNAKVKNIITDELNRSHYKISIKRFRENVSDYLDTFKA